MMSKGNEMLEPFRLGVVFVERVWGRQELEPWFSATFEAPVGEAWLTGEECLVETGPNAGKSMAEMEREFAGPLLGAGLEHFPLLVKVLFPQEKLSVQVHPDDAQAVALGGNAHAKTECWYVLEAPAGASVAVGVKPGTSESAVRAAVGGPELEDLLQQVPLQAGDMVYVEGGTVHVPGAGLVLLEVQQPSDTTFRLYDYGRARELHLEDGMKAIRLKNSSGKIAPVKRERSTALIEVEHFAVERFDVPEGESVRVRGEGAPECVVALGGEGVLTGEQAQVEFARGQAVIIPACCEQYSVAGACSFVRCHVPERTA